MDVPHTTAPDPRLYLIDDAAVQHVAPRAALNVDRRGHLKVALSGRCQKSGASKEKHKDCARPASPRRLASRPQRWLFKARRRRYACNVCRGIGTRMASSVHVVVARLKPFAPVPKLAASRGQRGYVPKHAASRGLRGTFRSEPLPSSGSMLSGVAGVPASGRGAKGGYRWRRRAAQ